MEIKAADVMKLRHATNAGMMDCKKALQEAEGDFDKAVDIIRKRGLIVASKRADREAKEGCVLAHAEGKKGVLVSLNCETDFVAKNENFINFTKQILDAAFENMPVTASEIADLLQVSIKTVTRQLVNVEKILNENDLILERKTSKGMQIIGTEEQRQKMLEQIQSNGLHEYSPVERQNIVLSHLLKSQEPIKLLTLAKLLNVTEATISNDLDKLETWIKKMNMNLVRKPGLGIYLEGLEKDIRKAIISHIYKNLHEKNILNVLNKQEKNIKLKSGTDKFLLDLVDKDIIQKVEKAITTVVERENYNLSINAFSGLVVHLTLAIQRLLKGEIIKIDTKFLTELKKKKEFDLAFKISEEIAKVFDIVVPEEESGFITMHLLGARNNYQEGTINNYDNFALIKIAKKIIAIAQEESGIFIAKKSKLLIGLVKHLGPAATRIKLNLEIRNPLLNEMKEKYPQWMKLAKKAAKPLEEKLGVNLPEAEIAYLAMHLGSTLEDASLQKARKYNVLVACPTGIGTSKLLASQLKQKFTNLNIVAIVSAININYEFYQNEGIDFIISTVEINEATIPVVIVNFMLDDKDIDNIIHQMQLLPDENSGEYHKDNKSLVEKLSELNLFGFYIKSILKNFFYQDMVNVNSKEELCSFVSIYLLKENISQILEADLKSREEKGSTIIKDLMLLHTKSKVIQNLTVGIIQLEKSLKINEKEISTVLILLVPDKVDEKALETMGVLSESIIENTNLLDILHQGSKAEIYLELEKIYTNYFKKKYKKVMEG